MNRAKLIADLREGERLRREESRLMKSPDDGGFPEVVTLCGSTKFKEQYLEAQKRLTLEGKIVISCGLFNHADNENITKEQKRMLDDLHLRKIDLSDSIYVIDVNGYIGESTKREIEYARSNGKNIKFYSQDKNETN